MSDLLKRKPPGLIERSQTAVPKNTFSIKDLETNMEPDKTEEVVSKKPVNTTNVNAEKSTTVRLNRSTKNKINALVTLGIASTVDDVTDLLINDYISNILTKDERKQFEIIFELYKSKSK